MAASTQSARAADHQDALFDHDHVVRRAQQQPEAPDSNARAVGECLVRLHERDAGHLDEAAGAHVVQLPGAGRVFEKGVEGAPPGPQREHPLDGVLAFDRPGRASTCDQLRVVVAAQRLVGRDVHGERRRSRLLLLEYGVLQFGQVVAGRDESHDVEPVARG